MAVQFGAIYRLTKKNESNASDLFESKIMKEYILSGGAEDSNGDYVVITGKDLQKVHQNMGLNARLKKLFNGYDGLLPLTNYTNTDIEPELYDHYAGDAPEKLEKMVESLPEEDQEHFLSKMMSINEVSYSSAASEILAYYNSAKAKGTDIEGNPIQTL